MTRLSFRLFVCVLAMCFASTTRAVIRIEGESLSFVSNGVTQTSGAFDIYLDVSGTDLSTNLGAWNVTLNVGTTTGTILPTDISFGAVTEPANKTDIFPSTAVTPTAPLDVSGTGANAPALPLFNNAGLMSVPFTVAAMKTGTFTVNVNPSLSMLFDGTPSALTYTAGSGTTTISAVPEASSFLMVGITCLGCVIARKAMRCRTTSPK